MIPLVPNLDPNTRAEAVPVPTGRPPVRSDCKFGDMIRVNGQNFRVCNVYPAGVEVVSEDLMDDLGYPHAQAFKDAVAEDPGAVDLALKPHYRYLAYFEAKQLGAYYPFGPGATHECD